MTVLTANSTIGAWLDDPAGGPMVRGLLAASGADESVLAPLRALPLASLVDMSQGAMPRSVVDDLVRQVNGGEIPESAESGWQEKITDGRFVGKTVIVTGAGSGIGKAVASRLVREGARVVAVDIAADRLAALGHVLDVVTVTADLSKPDDIAAIVAAAGEQIDGLANVAGINDDTSPRHEVSDQMWSRVLGVNLDGVMRLTRKVLPAMMAAGRGSIVNIASEAALRRNASGVAYTVSKHAVVGLTRSAAFMYGPKGIRVNAVAPGGVATGIPMAAEPSAYGTDRVTPFIALIPGLATAAQLAASITFLLSDDGVNVNGVVLPSDGGWSVQ
jgi:NAD(P)-dependent dehydrogenase (short-subunit alcohol dehydrogenase family)